MTNKKAEIVLTSEKELRKIGVKLKILRKSRGYTSPDKFSYEHNLNRSQYGKYEAGSANITIGTLINILNCFGVSLSDFFDEEYEKGV